VVRRWMPYLAGGNMICRKRGFSIHFQGGKETAWERGGGGGGGGGATGVAICKKKANGEKKKSIAHVLRKFSKARKIRKFCRKEKGHDCYQEGQP